MSNKIRKTGIDIIGNTAWGTHFCQFYKTKKDLINILVPYLKAGLENNEFCLWVTSKPLTEKDAARALAESLPDLDSYLKEGQIEIIPHDMWYMKNGVFDSQKVSKGLLRKLDKALAKGYDGLRLTGNTFWLKKKDWRSFTNYEKEVDNIIGEYNIIALCTYSLDKCGANEVIDVVRNHQFVLIKREGKWEIIESSERKIVEDETKRFASFPQLNPNPVLEVNSSGTIVFCNAGTIQALKKLNLRDTTLFLPNDVADILDALEQEKDVQFYREVKIKDRIFGEVLCLTPQFDSIRIYANDITERKSYQEALQNALLESRQHEKEMSALSNASKAILKYPDFKSAAREIFDYCKQLIGATSGYIALLSEDGTKNEVLFLDSGGLPCSVDPGLPMPIRGLRGEAHNNLKTVYENDFHQSDWMKFIPEGHVRLENVLFAPMVVEGKVVGLLGIANKLGGFTEADAHIASAFADLSAIALTQKRAEEAVLSERQRLLNILDSMEDGVYIVNQQYDIDYVNPMIEKEYGHVNGRKCHEYFEGLNKACTWCKNQEVFKGKTVRWEWYSSKTNKTYDLINTPLTNPDGSVSKLGIFRDITDRRRAEDTLRKTEERLQLQFDRMPIGCIVCDPEFRVLSWNPAAEEIFGFKAVEVLGKHPYGLIVPREAQKHVDTIWQRLLHGDATAHSVNENLTRDERIIICSWSNTPLKDADGTVIGVISMVQDITERNQAEEMLRKSQEDLDRAQAVGNIGSWRMDVQQNELTWSDENHRIFGIPKGTQMTYETFLSIVHPDDRKYVDTKWKAGLVGENYDIEHRIVVDGNTKWVREKAYLEFGNYGTLLGGFGITQDITLYKQMEDLLRKSRDELELRVQERTAELNKAYDRLSVTSKLLELFVTKPSRKEYLNSTVDLLRDWTDCNCIGIRALDKQGNIPYESYKGFGQEFWEAENWISVKNHQCACVRVVLQKPDPQDVNMMTANGSFYCNNTETFASMLTEQELTRYRGLCIRIGFKSVAIIPILYKEAVLGAIHIADKREGMVPLEKIEFIESVSPLIGEAIFRFYAEEALSESEERYRMLVETMNEGLGMDDENGLLVYANDRFCEMLGYSQEEIIGRPVLSFFDEKNQNILREQIEKRRRGESEPYRIEWMGKNNQKIITLVSPKGIFDENGDYRGSFAVITDITEKLRLESIAQAVNTMNNIGFIFSGIRHEIGNPVNSIKMALSVLKQNIDSYSKDTIKEYADRMLSEVSRMEYLLKAMKNFNMYETVELMDTDMTDFMNKFISLVKGDFEKRGIKVEASISEPAWIYADPRALQHVLLNILTNASDSLEGRQDPRITINVSKMADMVNIRVEDNGSGMTEEQQEDLFKPFYTSKAKGTGLGLVIAKKMMTKMKGFIEVVSEKDKGTIVDLFIPEGISE